MTDSILALDPGESTGWSLWALDDDYPIQRLDYGLVKGGMEGLVTFMEVRLGAVRPDVIVCEKWNVNDGRRGDPTEPLRIEGAMYAIASALGLELVFQPTSMKDQCHDYVLQDNGLWISPAEAKLDPAILWVDARDVNDSQIHALAWAKTTAQHEPTLAAYWPERVEFL